MSLFNNLRILDERIRDVIVDLSETQKADVLLHALQLLPIEGCRTTVENAVKLLLQVPNWPSVNVARVLLLRAQGRLPVPGHRASAQQDIHSVLTVDPENQDVKPLIQSQNDRQEKLLREPDFPPRFSIEVWREIALFLPKRDLKSLLFVSGALSHIASELLFRELDLHLTAIVEPSRAVLDLWQEEEENQVIDVWHNYRSADILTRILVDPRFAGQVKRLTISAASDDDTQAVAFQVGMLVNALPRLINLRRLRCSGSEELIDRVVKTVHTYNPRLQRLVLNVAYSISNIEFPAFKHLEHFGIFTQDRNSEALYPLVAHSRDTLRSLSIDNLRCRFPAEAITIHHLTHLQFNGHFPSNTQAFSEIFVDGHQLESLMLSLSFECTPSSLFRQYRTSLPLLRHFSFKIARLPRHIVDLDLCPAISEFVRERTQLQTYHLRFPLNVAQRVGFDASAWGVLPTLSKLSCLLIPYPKDLPPVLAGWLVPRTVRALTLDLFRVQDSTTFMNQLGAGMPPLLRYVSICGMPFQPVTSVVNHGFPNVRVVVINGIFWTITRSGEDGEVEMEQWPRRRVEHYASEWLESLGCSEAVCIRDRWE